MIGLLLALSRCDEDSGVGGFIRVNFTFDGVNSDLLTKLTVVVKTTQGSLVDSAEVQPTGYWIIPTPTHRELVITVHGPEGIIVSPSRKVVSFPFPADIDFQLLGFSITGKITTKTKNNQIVPVSASLGIVVESEDKKLRLSTTSSQDGSFSLGPVSSGRYVVTVKNAIVDPVTVVISAASVVCPQLLVTDWPQSGRIVFPEGVEPRKIKLTLTGAAQKMIETDAEGYFIMKNLGIGRYSLECAEEGVKITPLSFTVSSSELSTPITLNFLGVSLSGNVRLPNGNGVGGVDVQVLPTMQSATTDADGSFSFIHVGPCENASLIAKMPFFTFTSPKIGKIGTTSLSPVVITVINAKISGIVECGHAEINVVYDSSQSVSSSAQSVPFIVKNGSFALSAPAGTPTLIKVKSECGFETNEISVVAPNNDVKFQRIKAKLSGSIKCINECFDTTIMLSSSKNKYTIEIDENGRFSINDIEFGSYALSISAPQNIIWHQSRSTISVNKKELDVGEVADQTAFIFQIISSHEMKVECGKTIIQLARGTNSIETSGTVVYPADCHIFDPIDLRKNSRIKVTKVERVVKILGDTQESKFEVFINQKPLSPPYKFMQGLDETVTIQVEAISPYYVEPSKIEVRAAQSCEECQVTFEIIRGVEIRGKIYPSIKDVTIAAVSDDAIIASVSSSTSGQYTLGSHPSNRIIVLTASKQGYSIRQRPDSFDFDAEKLASITISFNGTLADGALVALTRADGYKHTETVINGIITFNNLQSGMYYIKPIKREYQFAPTVLSITLLPGQDAEGQFQVMRTRFGISGDVKRITGEPEPDIEVTATHPDGERTTDVTDAHGRFRLGNLLPNRTYSIIAIASGTSAARRITPESIKVKLGDDERSGVHFLSIRPSKSFDILGEVEIDNDFLEKITVVLTKDSNTVIDRYQFPSKSSNFFFFTNLTDDRYTITVASTRQTSSDLQCPSVVVERSGTNSNVLVHCDLVYKNMTSTANHFIASMISILSVIVWLCFFNLHTIKEAISNRFEKRKRN